MSVGISIKLTKNTVTPALQATLAALKPEKLNAGIATELKKQVQKHLLGRGRNKRGWPTTNFWPRAAKSTTSRFDASGAEVSINLIGVRQRYYGGRIVPVRAQALAIPISPVSYGHVPKDFPGLFLLQTKKGAYLVQRGQELSEKGNIVKRRGGGGNSKRRRQGELNFLFKLSSGVTQAPDGTVLPNEADLINTVKAEVLRNVEAAQA